MKKHYCTSTSIPPSMSFPSPAPFGSADRSANGSPSVPMGSIGSADGANGSPSGPMGGEYPDLDLLPGTGDHISRRAPLTTPSSITNAPTSSSMLPMSSPVINVPMTIISPFKVLGGMSKETGVVRVRRERLVACMTCGICHGLLDKATVASECLHMFCKECIFLKLTGEELYCCPVCKLDLGPSPW